MTKIKVKQIDVLVHPDYFQIDSQDLPIHRIQLNRRYLWEDRVLELREQPGGILLYFSNLNPRELGTDRNGLENKIMRQDMDRIQFFQQVLGSRFFVFAKNVLPSESAIVDAFTDRGFEFEPKETEVLAYGEIYGACVMAWGAYIVNELQIPDSNINWLGLSEELSVSFRDTAVIDRWRSRLVYLYMGIDDYVACCDGNERHSFGIVPMNLLQEMLQGSESKESQKHTGRVDLVNKFFWFCNSDELDSPENVQGVLGRGGVSYELGNGGKYHEAQYTYMLPKYEHVKTNGMIEISP